MDAIRQLANMAAKLNTPSGLTIDGNLTVTGTITGIKTISGSIDGNAATATSATRATSAGSATTADIAGSATTAGKATTATTATTASRAVTNTTFIIGNDSSSGSDWLKPPHNPSDRNGDVALVVKPLSNATKIRPMTYWCTPGVYSNDHGNGILAFGACNQHQWGSSGWYSNKSVAFFEGSIQCAFIYIGSDKRIKHNINEIIDTTSSLELFRKIKCSKYEYIDKIQHSPYKVHGFIAQELKDVIPEAISIVSDYIPNFYCMCSIEKYSTEETNNIFRVFIPINDNKKLIFTGNHDIKTHIEYKTVNGMPASDEYGNQFFKVKFKDELDNDIEVFTTKIIDEYSFLISISIDNDKIKEGQYFLYGQLVDNYHKIDNDHIHNITTTALKEVDKQQQIDKEKIKELEEKNLKLEEKVLEQQLIINNILERLNKLELK